jgi:hypothetical protein
MIYSEKIIKYFLSFILLFPFITMQAQQPAWTSYEQRNHLYPEEEYLTGFFSGKNLKVEDPAQLLEKYREIARTRLIQSIQVSIESNSSLDVSNVNGKSAEAFNSRSISFSKADISGLNTDVYYDKKNKEAYAFAWANKKELAFYKRKLIQDNVKKLQQKLDEGRGFEKVNDRENALRSFYEGMPLLSEAEEAQWLLMAIAREQFINNDIEQLRKLKLELDQELSSLQKSKDLNMSEAAYFIAYGLYVQLKALKDVMIVQPFTYENTELSSDFSSKWNDEIGDALIKTGHFNVKSPEEAGSSYYETSGNFWKEGEQLRIRARVNKGDALVAVSEAVIPVSWLENEHIGFVPDQFNKIELLPFISLSAIKKEFKVKAGQISDSPMEVKVMMNLGDNPEALPNVPGCFVAREGKSNIVKGLSDKNGLAKAYFPALNIKPGLLQIEASVNIPEFVGLDTNTAFCALVLNKYPVMPVNFEIQVIPRIYYIESEEYSYGNRFEIKTVEPLIKNSLADKGYQFSDLPEEADYIIRIKAAVTSNSNYQGIYFAYVDANLSFVDQGSGLEVFKTNVNQVKGTGANYNKAGKKAMQTVAEQLREQVISYLEE